MQDKRSKRAGWTAGLWACLAAAAITGASGCQKSPGPSPAPPSGVAGQACPDQEVFGSDEEAVKALVKAVTDNDTNGVMHIFGGSCGQALLSGDPVEDRRGMGRFARHLAEQWKIEKQTDRKSILHVGDRDWPYPIPIVQGPDGKWFFDSVEGQAEIATRRIGRNELETIKVCRAFVQAEREYSSKDRDGSGVLKYAQHFRSTPGKKDGLYWEAAPGQEESPAGAMVAEAALRGRSQEKSTTGPRSYMGYFFHILTKQGSAAPGGRYDYIINGNMIAGFAQVASPAKYGSSGIMTFLISHQGKLYEKDLGPKTHEIVLKMTEFNPDNTWRAVEE